MSTHRLTLMTFLLLGPASGCGLGMSYMADTSTDDEDDEDDEDDGGGFGTDLTNGTQTATSTTPSTTSSGQTSSGQTSSGQTSSGQTSSGGTSSGGSTSGGTTGSTTGSSSSWGGERSLSLTDMSNGSLFCDLVWPVSGVPSTTSCTDCDFTYDVTASVGVDYLGNCQPTDPYGTMTLGYAPNYNGLECVMMLYQGIFYPYFYADWNAPALSYWFSWENTYVSYTFEYSWTGTATIQ